MRNQHVMACPYIGPPCLQGPQQFYLHDEYIYLNDLVLDAELGLVKHLSIQGIFTLRQNTDRIQFTTARGEPYDPPNPDYHHRNETLVGPMDPWLMLRAGTTLGGFTLSGRAGITMPLGAGVPNPFDLGRLGLPHQHIQFGTGTWDPVVGASVDRRFGPVNLSAWTLNRFVLGTNGFGYQSGHKLSGGLTSASDFGLKQLSFTLGVVVLRELAERWGGVFEREGNLGRTDFLADATISWKFARGWCLTLGAKVLTFAFVEGEQGRYPGILTFGITTNPALGAEAAP